ncbi:MAG: hypothetical protein JST82_11920 [Bacteroidetes bacterium]|nr:hypothetical protein [Bacteroidota bacterium]
MKTRLLLLLGLIPVLCIAQDLYYPDALAFNGKVKEVKGYMVQEREKVGEIFAPFSIDYDYEKGIRTIKTYTWGKHDIMRSVEQNLNDESIKVTYHDVTQEVSKYRLRTEKNGDVTWTYIDRTPSSKTVYSYDKQGRVIRIKSYDSEGVSGWVKSIRYNADKTVTKESVYKDGITKSKNVFTYDEHGNPVKVVIEQWTPNYNKLNPSLSNYEKMIDTFTYTYDTHGNFTSYTHYYNGEKQRTLHRDITYAD